MKPQMVYALNPYTKPERALPLDAGLRAVMSPPGALMISGTGGKLTQSRQRAIRPDSIGIDSAKGRTPRLIHELRRGLLLHAPCVSLDQCPKLAPCSAPQAEPGRPLHASLGNRDGGVHQALFVKGYSGS